MYFKATFTYKDSNLKEYILLEGPSKAEAQEYTEYRLSSVPSITLVKVEKISKRIAEDMSYENCINWTSL